MATDRTIGKEAETDSIGSANDEEFSLKFSPVRWLELNKGATRIKRSNERNKTDELWHGDAFDPMRLDEPSVSIYARLGGSSALIAELVCGCTARALGLPAPEVFVVTIQPGLLPKSKQASKQETTLCVATRDLGGDTFTQLLNDDDDAALQLLRDWPDLNKVAAFDEWTANPDRNTGNLIYAAQTLHIIDHADAFGGASRDLYSLAEMTEQSFANKLAELLNIFDAAKRSEMLNEIGGWISSVAEPLDLPHLVSQSRSLPRNSNSHDKELVDFLTQRLTITHKLLCNRLGHPQLSLMATQR